MGASDTLGVILAPLRSRRGSKAGHDESGGLLQLPTPPRLVNWVVANDGRTARKCDAVDVLSVTNDGIGFYAGLA